MIKLICKFDNRESLEDYLLKTKFEEINMTREEIEIEIGRIEEEIADLNNQIEEYELMLYNLEDEEESE